MTNVDPDEIHKFNKSAEDWWDLKGSFRTLHHINPTRVAFIQKYCDLQDKIILDVGCGGGILSEALARHGAKITGLDMASDALKTAADHAEFSQLNIDYICTDVETYETHHKHQFDAITCMELLEHVPDPGSIIKSCSNLIKKEGWVFFSTLHRTLKAYLTAIIGGEYILGLLPKGTHDYEKFIKPSELAAMCRDNHLEVIAMKGMSYNPLTATASLTDNLDINYLIACKKQ